jgi:hypothetical protein
MPNTFIDNRDRWMQLSDIDYLGQFVKVWLAFNAWYRSAYTATQDRMIINEIKWQPNPISARFRPLLIQASEEAEQFRTEIGLLHHRLERYEIYNGKGDEKTRIKLSKIIIRTEPATVDQSSYRNWTCEMERDNNGNLKVIIKRPDHTKIVDISSHAYDVTKLESDANFNSLTDNLKSRFLLRYKAINPRIYRDLTLGDAEEILCGTHKFLCGPDFLFSGVIEVIYLLRCALFHGELVPTREASECYEPAYRIVRRFLNSIT